ncbi:GDSL-type esterase/lipase family protein [Clostridium sp. C8-1-8]|uniref:GDSL-type esterase/lipase family protein n=1 Tax=Clostridium sp. C8-1-8 TaxID=2698831 RepID=UPI001FAD903E|nr:GDSL-type esterase/lipase family protein [Clostridium sp. C8-1-8]
MELKEIMEMAEVKKAIDYVFAGLMEDEKKTKLKRYKHLNQCAKKGQVLFVGSSLMEQFPVNELQQTFDKNYVIYNRGISGYVTSELLSSMEECIFELEPSKIFINIGTNDISLEDYKKEKLIANYDKILTLIGKRLPSCKVYVMAYYPVNPKVDFPGIDKEQKEMMFKYRTNTAILEANEAVEELAKKHDYEFINVNEGLTDEEGNLKEKFSIEGLHMWPNAYEVILKNIRQYL